MKKSMLLVLSFTTLLQPLMQAQEFESTLAEVLIHSRSDSTLPQVAMSANQFEMIATKWNDQWLAHYYAAYTYTIYSYMETDEIKRDGLLDKADEHMEQARTLSGDENDELYILSAMIANARLAIKPGSRWKEYGVIFDENISKARQINADNPRIYYLQGNSIYYTPKMFGGGAKSALPYFRKADSLFLALPTPDSLSLAPNWGEYENTFMMNKADSESGNQNRKK